MTIPSKRAVPEQPVFTAGRTVEVKLQKGYLEESITIHIDGTVTLTAAATGFVPRGSVLQEVRLKGNQNDVLQAWLAHDLVIEQVIYEQNAESNQITLPSSTAIGGPYAFSSSHTLSLREPFADKLGDLTMLPTWLYDSLILQLVFGDATNLYTGITAAQGTLSVPNVYVTQNGVLDYPMPTQFAGNTVAFGAALGKAYKSYDTETFSGAKPAFPVDVPLTNDIRSMIILAYNASGVLDDTVIQSVNFKANNNTDINNHPWVTQKAENARVFGVPMPPGVIIIDSSEDKDIRHLYEVTGWSKASLIFATTAAGTVRVAYRKLAAGRG